MRKYRLKTILNGIFVALCAFSWTFSSAQTIDNPMKLTFVDHLKAGLIEVDVFVEKEPGSEEVYRVTQSEKEKYLNAPIFATAVEVSHDPFAVENAGPYPKGASFNMTLGEWLKASGEATYTCENGWATFKASFENLMPNSAYSMWHFFMPAPPTTPFTGTLDIPMGNRDGSQSVFWTDDRGSASFDVKYERCLQLGENQLMSGVAIAYHSDGKTYGPYPGEFGKYSHVQLFAMLPNKKTIPSE